MSDQMRVCPECGDLLPMPCSDPAACIMTDDLSDQHTNGWHEQISEHVDDLNKRIEELEAEVVHQTMAIGWMYAQACSMMDAGEDIRVVEFPELIAKCEADLSREVTEGE